MQNNNDQELIEQIKKEYASGSPWILIIDFLKKITGWTVIKSKRFLDEHATEINGTVTETDLQRRFPRDPEVKVFISEDFAVAMIEEKSDSYVEKVKVVQREGEQRNVAEHRAKLIALQLLRNNYGRSKRMK